MSETNGRINVSEDKLNSALSQLELRLVQQIQLVVGPMTAALASKADNRALEDVQRRLAAVELRQAAQAATENTKDRISARQLVLWGIVATVFAGIVAALATLVWLALAG